MGFDDFYGAIEAEALREVARHWQEARGRRPMPSFSDIRPSGIKSALPIVWSWKYDFGSEDFVGRLAGERIQSAFGMNLRGARMRDVFKDRNYEQILARHKRVMTGPALFLGKGLVYRHLRRFDIGERIILPLSDGGAGADGILGVTDFKTYSGVIADEVLRRGEIESWFAL